VAAEKTADRFPESYDDAGLTPVIHTVRPRLILYLQGIVRDPDEAEDLAEEAFLRLLIRKPVFPTETALKAWLCKVGRNLAVSHLRKEKHLVRRGDDPETEDSSGWEGWAESAEERFLQEETERELKAALRKLSPGYREILWLSAEGLPNEEIAAVTKKTRRQVENILYRARRQLRAAMQEEGKGS